MKEISPQETMKRLTCCHLTPLNNIEEACLSEEKEYAFLDNCASSNLIIIRNQSCLESFVYSGRAMQTT